MFWLRYFAALLIGSAAVYFCAQPLWDWLHREKPVDEFFAQEDPSEEEAEEEAPAYSPALRPGSSIGGLHKINVNAKAPHKVAERAPQPAAPAVAEAGADEAASAAASGANTEAVEEEAPPRMSVETIPQSQERIIRWSVLSLDSAGFSKEGKRYPAKAPGGTLAEIEKLTFTNKGEEMALCRLWSGDRWVGPVLVPTAAMVMFEGTREEIPAEAVEGLMEYCKINAALASRKAALEREAVDENPYAARVRELAAETKTLAAKAEELKRERDEATGARRAEIADRLREMEVEATRVNRETREQVEFYNSWKKAHPPRVVDYTKDTVWRDLEAKLRAAAPLIECFVLDDIPSEELPDE